MIILKILFFPIWLLICLTDKAGEKGALRLQGNYKWKLKPSEIADK